MRYSREDACRLWLAGAGLPYRVLNEICSLYPAAEEAYDTFFAHPADFDFLNDSQRSRLTAAGRREHLHRQLVTMQRCSMGIIALSDPNYPVHLTNISDPPLFLFYIGEVGCLLGKTVTMVGARAASRHGLDCTHDIAEELARCGVTIVSGLAMGIDAAAHAGALDGGGQTVAVMGCGLDLHYPIENDRLRERMLQGRGVLIGEYAPGTPARRGHFPVRNRILAGMSRATVMMECRLRSGTMHTIQHALDQGREVFAYPGEPGSPYAEGAHQLIREGARYFTSAADILEDLDWEREPQAAPAPALPKLTRAQSTVLMEITRCESSFEELLVRTGLDAAELNMSLTILQLSGLIKAMPGKTYRKV